MMRGELKIAIQNLVDVFSSFKIITTKVGAEI